MRIGRDKYNSNTRAEFVNVELTQNKLYELWRPSFVNCLGDSDRLCMMFSHLLISYPTNKFKRKLDIVVPWRPSEYLMLVRLYQNLNVKTAFL